MLSSAPLTSTSDDARRAAVIARVTRRIIPFVFICYVVAYIDRVNIGFAAACAAAGPRPERTPQYGLGAGLFFLGYCLFEIPSNLILDRGRRAALDRADHDRLGRRLDGDDVRHRRDVVL